MECYTEKNVDQIIDKVENLFTTKIGPYIEKTVQEQKDSLVKDILAQVRTNFLKELNGEDLVCSTENVDDYMIKFYDGGDHRKINPKYTNYNYSILEKNNSYITDLVKDDNMPTGKEVLKFMREMHNGEYIICIKIDFQSFTRSKTIDHCYLVTSFGSIYHRYFGSYSSCTEIFKNNAELPKLVLDIFLDNFISTTIFALHHEPRATKNFIDSVEKFQKWWQSRPLSGYTAELLKKENESIKKTAEKMKEEQDKKMEEAKVELDKKLEESRKEQEKIREEQNKKLEESRIEQERIKHMYETLELKDQYHKAVELLRQNKVERDLLDQDRRKFHTEKVESEIEMEEKNKKYRQIKDIDTEISRLALMKQKLEKDRKEFEKEREEFEDLRNKLMDS